MYKYVLLFSFIFVSCAPKEVTISYKDGQPNEVYTVNDDDQKHGSYKKYREDGSLEEESNYNNGKLSGKRKIYFPKADQIEIEELYQDGVMHGEHIIYYPSGKKMIESAYVNGKMEGLFTKYFEDGNIMEVVTFKDNLENGPFKEYYSNGQVQWEGSFLEGDKEFGLLTQFDEQGQVMKKMMCDSLGVCQTIWTPEKGDIEPKNLNLTKS